MPTIETAHNSTDIIISELRNVSTTAERIRIALDGFNYRDSIDYSLTLYALTGRIAVKMQNKLEVPQAAHLITKAVSNVAADRPAGELPVLCTVDMYAPPRRASLNRHNVMPLHN